MLPHKVTLALAIHPRQMNRALTLDIPDHLRHRILRRDRNHHVHVIRHQVPFFDSTLLLFRELSKHLTKMFPQLLIQRLAPTLGNEVEWRGGVAPPRSPRTGREPLDSSGSYRPTVAARLQCANKVGCRARTPFSQSQARISWPRNRLYLRCAHRTKNGSTVRSAR